MNRRRFDLLPLTWENSIRHLIFRTYARLAVPFREPNYLLVLGHIRAGSSLLSQLLSSNPAILGYSELHVGYQRASDLRMMLGKNLIVHRRFSLRREEEYVMDKVLHDWLLEPEKIGFLGGRSVRVVFLIRQPLPAIKSMVRTLGFSLEEARTYYVQRVSSLLVCSENLPPEIPRALVTYSQLVNRTDEAFHLLEQHLELSRPLTEEYEVSASTPRGNDHSDNLRTGRILRHRSHKAPEPEIPRHDIMPAPQVFRNTLAGLSRSCRALDEPPVAA